MKLYSASNGSELMYGNKTFNWETPNHVSNRARVVVFIYQQESAMTTFTTAVRNFIDDEAGVTAIEYGMIAALIAAGLAVGIGYITGSLSDAFLAIKTAIDAAI
jgi:pilus assembly protein Flp/PilA